MYPVQVCTKTDKVPTPRDRGNIDQLVMVFASLIISVIRAPEVDKTRNTDFRPDLIGSSQHNSASTRLKSHAIKGIVVKHRRKRPRYSLVFDKTVAPAARIDQPSCIKGISRLAIIGQGILQ